MRPASLGVLYSFLVVINGYRIREPAPVFKIEEDSLALVFDNFTTTGYCPCVDGDYTCWLFYLELNDVIPPGCNSPYDVNVVDAPPTKPPNQTNNLLGLGSEMTTLIPAEKDPDCWLVPLDSGRAPDCTFSRPKVNDSLMIFIDTELRDGTVELYPLIGGSFYHELGSISVPDSSTRNETLTIKDVDDVDLRQLGSDLNETFPIPDSKDIEMAFTKGFKPTIFNDTHVIVLSNIKPTMQYNKVRPRLPKPTESKVHYVQAIDVFHPVHTQSTNQNKNKLAMAMDRPQTTQPPPPPSTPSSSRPTGDKKRKKTKTTVTTSTVPSTSTTKMGQRKRKVTKTTTASTMSSTSVGTTRKKIKRTRTTVSADS